MQAIAKNDDRTLYALNANAPAYKVRDFYKAIEPAYGSVAINRIDQHGDTWVVMYTHRINQRVQDYRVSLVCARNGRLTVKGDYVC